MLTGALLVLAGCGGSGKVVTKTVTLTRPATVSTPAPRPKPAASAPSAAAGTFAAIAIAANADQAALPVGDAVFAPAVIAAAEAMSQAASTTATGTTAPTATHTHAVVGHASGEYAVADISGTFRHPSQIVLAVSASPAQPGTVDWNVVCFENSGGVGREEGHSTTALPTSKNLPLPAPSNYCIGSANVQLSKSGTVTISITG